MSDFDKKETLIVKLITFPLFIGASIYGAWVISWLWQWFIVPLGVESIGLWHAWGFMIITLIFKSYNETDITAEQTIGLVIKAYFKPSLIIGLGYIAKSLMV